MLGSASHGAVAKWLRRRSAKPLFSGSIPLGASMGKPKPDRRGGGMVDAGDLKSLGAFKKPRAGSSPAPGTSPSPECGNRSAQLAGP